MYERYLKIVKDTFGVKFVFDGVKTYKSNVI